MTDKKREIDLGQIGQRIQTARMKKNESVRDLAEKVGVSDRHIQAVESGGSGLSFPLFCDIRKELGISADYLIDGDGLIESRDSRRRFLERKITQQLEQCSLSQLERMETIIQQIIAMNEK